MRGDPEKPLDSLKGIGPATRTKLERIGLRRIGDLLLHLPLRYEDRSRLVPLRQVRPGEPCLVQGEVVDTQTHFGKRRSWTVTIEDGTGYLTLRFFHFSRQQQSSLKPGVHLRGFGTPRFGPAGLEMAHPEYRTSAQPLPDPEPELTPVYAATQGLPQSRFRALVDQLIALQWPEDDGWPYEALLWLHRPPGDATGDAIAAMQQTVAREEMTAYYLIMRHRQSERARQRTTALPPANQLGRELRNRLPFRLTDAQVRVVTEVLTDLTREIPMFRLLQGDVGSGKTVVAAFAAVRAAEHNMQTAVMAPTEILAEQHYLNFSNWLEPLGIQPVLLTGKMNARERRSRLEALAQGAALVAVGTHALFQDTVQFAHLGLSIIDEQHRFGVHQRMALRHKGQVPHQLTMTATPIPRTLTMALYADMDVSVIDELPAGRKPITTRVVPDTRRAEIVERIRNVLQAGQQAYWVCTLIEESEQFEASAAIPTYADLSAQLSDFRVALLHGRMPSDEKAATMQAFKEGEFQLLVATTVIEVGVDVPNATTLVIEDPERLGLAQLHQLRGRVGRGEHASHCVLLYRKPLSDAARKRLQVIRDSQDGFYIAEQDLALRGPGEILGARQTGEQQFRVADLARDAHLIPDVVERAKHLLATDREHAARLLRVWAPADVGEVGV